MSICWTCSQIGLRMPHLSVQIPTGFVAGFVAAALAGIVLGVFLARRKSTRNPDVKTPNQAKPDPDAMKMLPRTPREQGWLAVLAITAGITEEVIWRGVLLDLLAMLRTRNNAGAASD